jgi:hypothetical protein
MITPNGITERIHAQADADLRASINAAVAPMRELLNDGNPYTIETKRNDPQETVTVYYRETMRAIEEKAFAVHQERNRLQAVADFMRKVNELDSRLSELRDSIPQ